MTIRATPVLCALVLALGACGDDDGVSDAAPDFGMDAAPSDGSTDLTTADQGPDLDADGCLRATAGDWELDVISDTGERVIAPLELDFGERPWDLYVWFQRFGDLPQEGVIALGEGPNESFPDCPQCVVAFQGSDLDYGLFAESGTIELISNAFDPRKRFVLRDVVLREVTIGPGEGPGTLVSTPVPGGRCVALDTVEVNQAFPPETWRCEPERYAAGDACDCACGAWDPDCFPCSEFPPDPACDPTPLPVVGCVADQVCAGQDAACYYDCSESGSCDFGTCVWEGNGNRICETDTDRFDPAGLGEACGDTFGLTYCAEEVGVARGMCAEWYSGADEEVEWECRPFCEADTDCDTEAHEYCEIVFGDVAGYCLPDYPRSWTCNPAAYEDGAVCHCGCGAWDPDCGRPDEPPQPAMGCPSGQVCVPQDAIFTMGQSECVVPPVNGTCATATVIVLPFDGAVDTRGAANDFMAAGCFPFEKWGFDTVYAMDLAAGQRVRATLTTADGDVNAALYVAGPGEASVCEGDFECIAEVDATGFGEAETLTFGVPSAGRYYLVVDSFASRSVNGQLTVSTLE